MEKIINEIELDYLMLDSTNEEAYKEVNNMITNHNKNIILISRIGDLYSLKDIKNVYKYSSAVELAMNYFCKELSYVDVIISNIDSIINRKVNQNFQK